MRGNSLGIAALIVCGIVASSPARAAQCTASTVGINFGNYDPRSATDDNSAGSVSISCSGGGRSMWTTVSIGTGNSGTFSARQMSGGAYILDYNIYADATRTQVWGDGSAGTATVPVEVQFGLGTQSVYGQVPAGQNVGAGTYGDTVLVTVQY